MQKNIFERKINISKKFDGISSSIITGDILKTCVSFPPNFFQLIITSPPYNIGKDYEKKQEFEKYLDWQEDIIGNLLEFLHPQGSICWQVGNFVNKGEVYPLDIFFYQIFKKFNLKLRNRIILAFQSWPPCKQETIWSLRDIALVHKI